MHDRENRRNRNDEDGEEVWKELNNCLLGVAEEVYAEVQKVLQDTNNHGGETMSQVKLMMRKELYMTEVQERK